LSAKRTFLIPVIEAHSRVLKAMLEGPHVYFYNVMDFEQTLFIIKLKIKIL